LIGESEEAHSEEQRLANQHALGRRADARRVIDHNQAGRDADARLQRTGEALEFELGDSLYQRKRAPHRTLSVILAGQWITETREDVVNRTFGDEAAVPLDDLSDTS
jgi:hypothetical protein